MEKDQIWSIRKAEANSTFAIGGVSCSADSLVVTESFMSGICSIWSVMLMTLPHLMIIYLWSQGISQDLLQHDVVGRRDTDYLINKVVANSVSTKKSIEVKGKTITILRHGDQDYISLTDMLKGKDGDFFISDWLRNRNTVEFLGIWETVNNPDFNYGEFATISSQAGLNNFKIEKLI